jgi:hypothetical protein
MFTMPGVREISSKSLSDLVIALLLRLINVQEQLSRISNKGIYLEGSSKQFAQAARAGGLILYSGT